LFAAFCAFRRAEYRIGADGFTYQLISGYYSGPSFGGCREAPNSDKEVKVSVFRAPGTAPYGLRV
jgi:hypothetical protein